MARVSRRDAGGGRENRREGRATPRGLSRHPSEKEYCNLVRIAMKDVLAERADLTLGRQTWESRKDEVTRRGEEGRGEAERRGAST
eukprot:192252-Hanusia_phi.AAC.2